MKIAGENWQAGGFGIYLHWPFCAALCPYCDFNSHLFQTLDYTAWQDAFITDLRAQHQRTQGRVLNSVFFGGGTPSLMPPSLVGAILEGINALWGITDATEITLEANPTSVEAGNFAQLTKAGVNRLSLGVQALNDTDLGRLGRLHTADEAVVACDLVVAADNARFGLPEVKRGLVATSGALFRASRVLPLNVAKQLLMTGADLSPQRGHELGLVNEVTEPGRALDGAMRLAETMATNAPVAVQQSLRVVEELASANDEDGWTLTTSARKVIGASDDAQEGVNAFFEKRKPTWTGR